MATVPDSSRAYETPVTGGPVAGRVSLNCHRQGARLHRLAEVRQQQGLSLRSVARQLSSDVRAVRTQEEPESDLTVSELYRWQRALGVPVSELLVDPEAPLSQPIMRRAQLVRIMKTAKALEEKATTPGVQRLVAMLMEQLIEIMPELKDVGPWHSVGQRRSLDEYGRAAERLISEEAFSRIDWQS